MGFGFTSLSYLWLLFLIPVLVFFHFHKLRNIKDKSLKFANFGAIAKIKGIDLYSKNIINLILNVLMIVSLVFALSGLTWYREQGVSSFSFVIVIDASESMGATDLEPNRLSVAKQTSMDFVDSLPSQTRIGVVSFSGNAFIEQELVTNKQQVKTAINSIELTNFGGTDVYEAVSISASMLDDEENKAIILLSDGQINVGDLYNVLENVKLKKIIIHAFGIGTKEGGKTSYGMSKLDEDSLTSLAYSSNGQFFKVNSKADMTSAFSQISPLTVREVGINLGIYFILITLGLFIVQQFLLDFLKIKM